MKKIFIIVLFFGLASSQMYSQHRYIVRKLYNYYPVSSGTRPGCSATFQFDGQTIFSASAPANPTNPFFFEETDIITFDNLVEQYRIVSSQGGLSPCSQNETEPWSTYPNNVLSIIADCFNCGGASVEAIYLNTFENCNLGTNLLTLDACRSVNLKVTPIGTPGNSNLNINYEIEYDIGGGFKNLYPKRKGYNFNMNYDDLIAKEPSYNFVTNNFRLRIRYFENDAATSSSDYSDAITCSFVECSPRLTSGPDAIATKCSYDDTGSFTVQFDRGLYEDRNERMLVYVEKYNPDLGSITNDAAWNFNDGESYIITTTASSDIPMPGRNLTWPEVLSVGKYRLRWVSKYGVDPTAIPNSDEESGNFDIAPTPPITFTSSKTDSQCYNPSGGNGTITFSNVTGGVAPYDFSIDNGANWQPSSSFSGLDAGDDYVLLVRERRTNGCISQNADIPASQRNITIEEPTSIPLITTGPFPIDQPDTIGGEWSIEVSSSGGTGAHTYVWTKTSGPATFTQNGNEITGNGEGTFRVTAYDVNSCASIQSDPFTIIEPDPIDPLGVVFTRSGEVLNSPEVLSCPGSRVNISAQGTGGLLTTGNDYTYLWSDGVNDPDRYNIGAGTYTVTITDNNPDTDNNSLTRSYVLEDPDPIIVTGMTSTNVLCMGGNTGNISLTIEGGTGSYNVTWTKSFDLDFSQTGSTISGLTEGFYYYTITIGDSGGCSINNNSNPIEITEPFSSLGVDEIESSRVHNTFYGETSGELEIDAYGGTGSYTYSWTKDGLPYSGTGSKLTGLGAGSYQVRVIEGPCSVSLETPIVIEEPDDLLITSVSPTHVNCYGESTGSIGITVEGGVGNYSYVWIKQDDASFTATTSSITNLSSGFYEVEVRDESMPESDRATRIIEITENTEIVITLINQENNICYNDNQGSLDITVTGGVSPYSYQWSNGEETEDISGLQTGDYIVTVTDALGCRMVENYEITQPDDAVAISSIELTQITAFGTNDGSIDLTISGGLSPYTFDWFSDNGFTSSDEDISNLGPGNYTVVVSDANLSGSGACTAIREFEIIEPGILLVSIEGTSRLYCNGDTDGELTANVSGGVSPFSYEWYEVSGSVATILGTNTAVLSNIGAGTYRVEITDANNIQTQSTDFILSEPEELLLTEVSRTNVLCYGASTGAIDMTITGGTLPYYISWDNGSSTEDIENLSAGNYTITVEDSNGCVKETMIEIINVNEELLIDSFDFTDVSSFDGTDGNISIDFSGGASPFTIEWVLESTNEVVGNTTSINDLIAGDYRVNITDVNGCNLTETYTLTEPDIVVATIVNPTCTNFCDGSITLLVDEGNGNFTYTWSNGGTSGTLTNLCSGTYTVAIGGYGGGDRILERTYEVVDPAPLVIDIGEDRVLCQGQSHILDGTIEDAGATYQWVSDNGFTASTAMVELLTAGTYTLTVTSSLGCQATDEVTITRTESVISSEFAISSQVFTGEPVVVVNLSNPVPDSLEWELPAAGEVLERTSDFIEMVFNEPGEYSYGMLTKLGDCESYQEKTIVVIDRSGIADGEEAIERERIPSVIEFRVFPNPSTGIFTLELGLKEEQKISLKVFGLIDNTMVDYRENENRSEYTESYDLSRLPSGMYFILLETPTTTQIKKIVID